MHYNMEHTGHKRCTSYALHTHQICYTHKHGYYGESLYIPHARLYMD